MANRTLHRARILSKLGMSIAHAKIRKERRPIFMGFYLTNTCNLRCSYCFTNIDDRFDDPKRPGFSGDEAVRIVDELYDMGTRWIFLLGGEPLVHKEIGRVVDHIVGKGMLLHIVSNGSLVERHIDDIQAADCLCVSVDGLEEATDAMRGKGAFKNALHGIEVAKSKGMTVRIHAVLSKPSLADMEDLAEIAKDMGISISISPPNYLAKRDYLGSSDDPDLQLTREDYVDFYQRYRDLKVAGYPINNSLFSIDKSLEWPIEYHDYIKVDETHEDYKPIPCVISDLHGCIDAEGTMFNCIQLGCLNGPNIKEVGVKKAWELLRSYRPNCVSCSSVNTIEVAAYLNVQPEIVRDGVKFFFNSRRHQTRNGKQPSLSS